jgi:hypothetical protein
MYIPKQVRYKLNLDTNVSTVKTGTRPQEHGQSGDGGSSERRKRSRNDACGDGGDSGFRY